MRKGRSGSKAGERILSTPENTVRLMFSEFVVQVKTLSKGFHLAERNFTKSLYKYNYYSDNF